MNEYRIRITRQARDHLREIRKYIECELLAPVAAKNFSFRPALFPAGLLLFRQNKKIRQSLPDFPFSSVPLFRFFRFLPSDLCPFLSNED